MEQWKINVFSGFWKKTDFTKSIRLQTV